MYTNMIGTGERRMYFAIFLKNVKQQLIYRSEFLLSIFGNLLYIYIQVFIWRALLTGGAPAQGGVGLPEMVTYVIISYLLSNLTRTQFTATFGQKVNRGDIAVDLIRPASIKNMLIAEQLSQNVCALLLTYLPVAVLSVFIWGMHLPVSSFHVLSFIVSVLLATAIRFYIDYIAGLCVFWTRNSVYTRQIVSGLFTVFSGAVIPLWFYPVWLRSIGEFLPFHLISFILNLGRSQNCAVLIIF